MAKYVMIKPNAEAFLMRWWFGRGCTLTSRALVTTSSSTRILFVSPNGRNSGITSIEYVAQFTIIDTRNAKKIKAAIRLRGPRGFNLKLTCPSKTDNVDS